MSVISYAKKTNNCIELNSVTVTPNVLEILSCCRFGNTMNHDWSVDGKTDAIYFSLSKGIELCGLLSCVCLDGLSTCDVIVTVKHNTTYLIVVTDTIDSKLAENKMVKIEFKKPIKLLANNKYHVGVVMQGPRCYAGSDGQTVVDSNGVVFTFDNSPFCNNGTDTGRRSDSWIVIQNV
ncbi:unnamed protein product [Mytilus edulis]|uniref:PHR domain-containing protein n=1 Tax=Mytilus edulis TaxID=6550 RepID=A0A8S3TQX4_MYTED|nr:unnamed protein product [Mytilus edulis]